MENNQIPGKDLESKLNGSINSNAPDCTYRLSTFGVLTGAVCGALAGYNLHSGDLNVIRDLALSGAGAVFGSVSLFSMGLIFGRPIDDYARRK